MYSHESLTEIEKDLRMAFLAALQQDGTNATITSADMTTRHFMKRITAFTYYFAYEEARRLTSPYGDGRKTATQRKKVES